MADDWSAFPVAPTDAWSAFPVAASGSADKPSIGGDGINPAVTLPKAFEDIPRQVGNTAIDTLDSGISDVASAFPGAQRNKGQGFWSGVGSEILDAPMRAGRLARGLASLGIGVPMAPITGAAQSLIGHPLTDAEHWIGTKIAPDIANKDDLGKMYDQSAQDVAKGLMTLAPSKVGPIEPVPTGPKVLSNVGQTAHDTISDAIQTAKTSGNVPQGMRTEFSKLKNDDDFMSSLAPEQQSAVKDLSNTPVKKSGGETSDLAILALEGVLPSGVASALLGTKRAVGAIGSMRRTSSALSSAEKLRQSVIDGDPGASANPAPVAPAVGPTGPSVPLPPQPWGPTPQPSQVAPASPWGPRPAGPTVPNVPLPPPPAPAAPDPVQLKLQMDQLVNQRRVLAKAQAAQAAAVPPPAPPAPPPINPNALPTSITTPAKNIMGGLANSQAMQAAANPLAKYDAAVRMNAGVDRQNVAALAKDATGLMAARKAAAAAEEAPAEPVEPEGHTADQIKEVTQLMAARKANAKLAAAQAAPPVVAKISKANGTVKETQAPQPDDDPVLVSNGSPHPGIPIPPELPQSDYSHLPRAVAAKLITDRAFANGKNIAVSPEEYHAGVMEKLTAKEHIADDMAQAMPDVEHQDINAHLQGAKTKAQAMDVMNHYIKLHPEAEAALRLALAKKRLNAGWTR